jgi:hypothetical protein
MTSLISKEDVEDQLIQAGVRSPVARGRIMRCVDLYARRFLPAEDLPPIDLGDFHGYRYKCPEEPKGCGERKFLAEFPQSKKINPRSPVPCNDCMKRK